MERQQWASLVSQWFNPSAYLPVSDADVDASNTVQLKPKFGQILRSKRLRYVLGAALILALCLRLFFGPATDFSFPYPSSAPKPQKNESSGDCAESQVNWSRYAYTQYVTNTDYLCNSVMLFEILHRLGSKADRLMMYPSEMHPDPASPRKESQLLLKAQKEYGVKLMPIKVQHHAGGDRAGEATWEDSYTKLLAFNQTQYDRVLSLDSDSTVLQHMDELFLLPPSTVAMPRAYWLAQPDLSSQLLLIQPSAQEFARVKKAIDTAKSGDFDMEIVNTLYGKDSMIIPHRRYDLLTGEFRKAVDDHVSYLGNDFEKWDPAAALKEAKFLHFSDWPVPKPWITTRQGVMDDAKPKCVQMGETENCRARDIWLEFYEDFRRRRKAICGFGVMRRSESRPLRRRPREFHITS